MLFFARLFFSILLEKLKTRNASKNKKIKAKKYFVASLVRIQ